MKKERNKLNRIKKKTARIAERPLNSNTRKKQITPKFDNIQLISEFTDFQQKFNCTIYKGNAF